MVPLPLKDCLMNTSYYIQLWLKLTSPHKKTPSPGDGLQMALTRPNQLMICNSAGQWKDFHISYCGGHNLNRDINSLGGLPYTKEYPQQTTCRRKDGLVIQSAPSAIASWRPLITFSPNVTLRSLSGINWSLCCNCPTYYQESMDRVSCPP